MWSTSLSMDTSGMHLQTISACRTPAESGQEYLTSGKEYTEPCNTTKEGGGNRSLSRPGPALGRWGNKQGSDPHSGAIV